MDDVTRELGDDLRRRIEHEFVVETTGWASERVDRVTERLQRGARSEERFQTLVVWLAEHNAFIAPGRTIYFSRRLLERLPDDDAAAFIVAHELAHFHLGHIPTFSASWWRLGLRVVLLMLTARVARPDRERDADLLGIELCLDAGYDPERCIAALEHLANVSLDYGDIDGALGDEAARGRSHDPVRDRIAAVRSHVIAARRGDRISRDVTKDRERRWRRVALATVGSAALTIALVVLWRRAPGTP